MYNTSVRWGRIRVAADFECVAAVPAGRKDPDCLLQDHADPKSIPRAVCPPDPASTLDPEIRFGRRERTCHADFSRFLVGEDGLANVQLQKSLAGDPYRNAVSRGYLRHRWRKTTREYLIVDKYTKPSRVDHRRLAIVKADRHQCTPPCITPLVTDPLLPGVIPVPVVLMEGIRKRERDVPRSSRAAP